MRAIIFFFLFFILVSVSYAYDCNQFVGIDRDNCVAVNGIDENLVANILYKNTTYPNYAFVNQYNSQITVTAPPNGTINYSKGVIRDAWIKILTINPSIYFENATYVPKNASYRMEYNYSIILPQNYNNPSQVNGQTCKILYSKSSEQSGNNWLIDNQQFGSGKNIEIISTSYTNVQSQANIQTQTRADAYVWQRYCCKKYGNRCTKYCYNCQFQKTTYTTDTLTINYSVNIKNYAHEPNASFTITAHYSDTYKGFLTKDNQTSVSINLNNSYYSNQLFVYSANFSNKPYNFLYLIAQKEETKSSRNVIVSNNSFYVHDAGNCSIQTADLFTIQTKPCLVNITNTTQEQVAEPVIYSDFNFLFRLMILGVILFIIYRLIKQYGGKALIPIACLLLFMPVVRAEDCGLTNLASCIPAKIYDYFLQLVNAPLEPLLNLIKNLLNAAPSIGLFQHIWAIIVYCISLLYGLLIVYSGFLFLFSGHDVVRREMAKEWLKNTIIMIVLIQASFYLYSLFVDLGSKLTTSIMTMVDPHFFMLTADNLQNLGFELLFVLFYALILLITLILLTIRYLVVAFGVLFIPIGIFCYFVPPIKSYGRLILHILGLMIFITFLDAILILACSMLIQLPEFQGIKIIVMITCFLMIDLIFVILIKHIINKTGIEETGKKIISAAKYVGAML